MTAKFDQILDAIQDILLPTSGVSARANRSIVYPSRREALPAIRITPQSNNPTFNAVGVCDWELTVAVSILNLGGDEDAEPADKVAAPIIADAYARLMADRTLGGLAIDVMPSGQSFRFADGDLPLLATVCTFTVTYRTQQESMEA